MGEVAATGPAASNHRDSAGPLGSGRVPRLQRSDQVQEPLWPDADPSPWPEVGPEAEDPFDGGVVCRYRRKT